MADEGLQLHLTGGLWGGEHVRLEPCWPFPDEYWHMALPNTGRYVRVEQTAVYRWTENFPEARDG